MYKLDAAGRALIDAARLVEQHRAFSHPPQSAITALRFTAKRADTFCAAAYRYVGMVGPLRYRTVTKPDQKIDMLIAAAFFGNPDDGGNRHAAR
jgi:hypothetical protein